MSVVASPLAGLRVVEFSGGHSEITTRILADLGAQVLLVEFPEGARSRRRGPFLGGESLYFASRNAGKTAVVADPDSAADRARLAELVAGADVVVDSHAPGELATRGIDLAGIAEQDPGLIVVSISGFGATGPYRDLRASDAVLAALGGVLSRSGLPGRAPVLPPAEIVSESAGIQAAWCVLLAVWNRRTRGMGDVLDISLHDAVAQTFDPALGVTGTAATGASGLSAPRGRQDESHRYPIVRSADGHVRMAVLAPRQWHALRAWLGDPPDLMAAELDDTRRRFAQWHRIGPAVEALFATRSSADLVAEGHRRGVAIEQVAVPAGALTDEHFAARGAFADFAMDDQTGLLPAGFIEVDGARRPVRGLRHAALGEAAWAERTVALCPLPGVPVSAAESRRVRPLSGLRVLDLGVIVAGAESGRLFASQGADVIKVENSAFPDGSRHSAWGTTMNVSFASGHRGKSSLGLDLRSARGKELFLDLVREADLVLSNFKPGTLEKLGIGPDVLRAVNPRIIVADSSALGSTGPRRDFMGYGPLVRATTALTDLWRDPEADDGFCDSVTIYPDHLVGRVCAIGAMALLIARESSNIGGTVSVSQAEVILNSMPEVFLAQSLPDAVPGDERDLVVACGSADDWVALTLTGADDRARLAGLLGLDTGATDELLEAGVRGWAAPMDARAVMTGLQEAGIAAGSMTRVAEMPTEPQLVARDFVRLLDQPGLAEPLPVENAPCGSRHLLDPALDPAPSMFQHTRAVAETVLGLAPDIVQSLVDDGVLEVCAETDERTADTGDDLRRSRV